MGMKTTTEKSRSVLNDLIETCRDGQRGFQTAADHAKDAELAELFRRYSSQRAEFARELTARVNAFGGQADQDGSVSGALHRGWIDIKSAVSSREPHAVLAECERGEDVAVKNYRRALEQDLDPISREIVSRHHEQIQAAHDRVKQLRDSATYARD
jgi:uncharacterized protein (TIGR02284 family)